MKNFYALELMMAPYAIGHMKMSFLLESLGYQFQQDESFKLYLTNTLEMDDIAGVEFPGLSSLSTESRLAGNVKREPILVIIGNPPYSGMSSNNNDWTEKLLKRDIDGALSYYKVNGNPLGERNPKWLQDDYVKFLRFAQWKIQKAHQGIVAMITNHAYLDNPTFRGMRQSLMQTFDEIFILDLHGNSLKKETAPNGAKDENVFDIRQGVAIAFFVKNNSTGKKSVKHADLYGLREEKYNWLNQNDITTCHYSKLNPSSPYYFLIKRDVDDISHYLDWQKVNEIFPVNSVGVVTSRDNFVINQDKALLNRNILQFSDLSQTNEIISQAYNLSDTANWSIARSRYEVSKIEDIDSKIRKILYRPFDSQFIFYHPSLIERMRSDVMRHMLENNIALITVRQVAEGLFNHCFITDTIVESRITLSNKGIGYLFPLYLFPANKNKALFSSKHSDKEQNLNKELLKGLVFAYKSLPTPEDILYYIYAILYSQIFREVYAEYLKYDFPRIPFTNNFDVFQSIASLGKRLIDLHLLKSPSLDQPTVKYEGQGDDHTIAKPVFNEQEKRVYINKTHYFEGVELEAWKYQIGGYQVMDKYLKDRKGRKMDDPRHYIHIATALAKTIEIQAEIDAIYPEVERDVIEF